LIQINTKNDLEIHLKKQDKVLALFYTSWCPFCRRFMKIYKEDVDPNSFDIILCVKLDDYSNPLWEQYSIENVPTVIFFDKGKIIQRIDAESGLGLTRSQFADLLAKC